MTALSSSQCVETAVRKGANLPLVHTDLPPFPALTSCVDTQLQGSQATVDRSLAGERFTPPWLIAPPWSLGHGDLWVVTVKEAVYTRKRMSLQTGQSWIVQGPVTSDGSLTNGRSYQLNLKLRAGFWSSELGFFHICLDASRALLPTQA